MKYSLLWNLMHAVGIPHIPPLRIEVCKNNHSFVIVCLFAYSKYIWKILPPSSFSFCWCSLSSMRPQMVVSIATLATYTIHLILARQKLISFHTTLQLTPSTLLLQSYELKVTVEYLVQCTGAQAQIMGQQRPHTHTHTHIAK